MRRPPCLAICNEQCQSHVVQNGTHPRTAPAAVDADRGLQSRLCVLGELFKTGWDMPAHGLNLFGTLITPNNSASAFASQVRYKFRMQWICRW